MVELTLHPYLFSNCTEPMTTMPSNKKEQYNPLSNSRRLIKPLGNNRRRLSVHAFKGRVYVDFRQWYETETGKLRPSQKGLALSPDEWRSVVSMTDRIENQIRVLEEQEGNFGPYMPAAHEAGPSKKPVGICINYTSQFNILVLHGVNHRLLNLKDKFYLFVIVWR